MFEINLPPFSSNIKRQGDKLFIFDMLRQRFVALTPEEWVRQHFIHFLVERKGYPQGLLGNEISLKLNGMTRRCDSVLYDKQMNPVMILEYKAPQVAISQKVFNQICAYNVVLHVRYLVISNGLQHFCCQLDDIGRQYVYLSEIPDYSFL